MFTYIRIIHMTNVMFELCLTLHDKCKTDFIICLILVHKWGLAAYWEWFSSIVNWEVGLPLSLAWKLMGPWMMCCSISELDLFGRAVCRTFLCSEEDNQTGHWKLTLLQIFFFTRLVTWEDFIGLVCFNDCTNNLSKNSSLFQYNDSYSHWEIGRVLLNQGCHMCHIHTAI